MRSNARNKRSQRSDEQRRVLPRFEHRLRIGDGLSVSPFCLGVVGDWKLIPAAFEMGINFFFVTTDMHWPAYEASRKGLRALLSSRKSIREEIAIAGVCYPTQPEFMVLPFQELVDSVPGMTRVDVLVAGGAYGADLLARVTTLRAIVERTQASAIAASFHDRAAALAAANHNLVDLCYIRYNPVHSGARQELLPRLTSPRSLVFNFKSMHGYISHRQLRELEIDPSLWYPEASDYYRYALSRPQMDGLLFSVTHYRQLEELRAALTKEGLSEEEEVHLDELATIFTRIASQKP